MQTGFVGLGAMGADMARNLHRSGLLTGVWNRTAGKATALAEELKCHAFASLAELAGNCEAVVICVSADDDLRAVVAGLDPGLTPNMLVIDCSTVGAGTAAKATNQIMCAGIIQAVGEAMAFAHAEGLPLDRLIETLGKGAGSSWYFVNRAPFMAHNSYPAGFRVRLHAKDLRICRDMAAQHGAQLPVVESTLAQYGQLIVQGFGDEDISAIYRLKSALFPAEREAT